MPASPPNTSHPLKPVDFLILLALADEDRHGYGILREIEATTNGALILDTGNLYRSLRRLVASAWIERLGPTRDGDERRRDYRLTKLGRSLMVTEARRMNELMASPKLRGLVGDGT